MRYLKFLILYLIFLAVCSYGNSVYRVTVDECAEPGVFGGICAITSCIGMGVSNLFLPSESYLRKDEDPFFRTYPLSLISFAIGALFWTIFLAAFYYGSGRVYRAFKKHLTKRSN